MCLARSDWSDDILAKYFYNVHIRAAPLIVTHAILFLNDNDSAVYLDCLQLIQLIKYYNYSQNMGLYSIIPGFCGAPWAVGGP